MTSEEVPLEEQFKKKAMALATTICKAVDSLYKEGYTKVPPLVFNFIPTMIQMKDPVWLIEGFIDGCHTTEMGKNGEKRRTGVNCWDFMYKKDEEFFLANVASIFRDLPEDKVNQFVELYKTKDKDGNSIIDKKTRDSGWKMIHAMIRLAIRYVHSHRDPYSLVDETGKVKKVYGASFMDYVNIGHNVRLWKMSTDLAFPLR
jgi:hypothetical protein